MNKIYFIIQKINLLNLFVHSIILHYSINLYKFFLHHLGAFAFVLEVLAVGRSTKSVSKVTMQSHHGSLYTCQACLNPYQSKRALATHLANSLYCSDFNANASFEIKGKLETYYHSLFSLAIKKGFVIDNKTEASEEIETEAEIESTDFVEEEPNAPGTDDTANHQTFFFTNNEFQEIKLLKLLNDIGTPLYAYKQIMDWAKDAHLSSYNFGGQYASHEKMIKFLQNKMQIKLCQPTTIPVKLMHDDFQADVVVFDVKQALMSLFDNQDLNQDANLVVNPKDVFAKYDPPDDRFGEINSGTWYNNAYHNCVKDPENDFLCPIVLANDKTTLSDMGDLHVDAIFMTTSLFDIKVSFFFQKCNFIF